MALPLHSQVTAFAPATVANLGPGFDVLGLALEGPGDTVTARRVAGSGVRIAGITGDGGKLPREAERNCAGIAAAATLVRAGVDIGVELTLDKGLPIGSGTGSSAASAAAAAMATNLLLGSPLRKRELIEPCLEAEVAVSGRHADNVAPAVLGGLVLVRSLDPLDLVRLPLPPDLQVAVVLPEFELKTRDARDALPREVPLSQLVAHSARLAGLVSACYTGDLALFSRCVVDDVIAPCRAPLIPGCQDVIDAACDAGALGSSISGSGPAVFALCRSRRHAVEVAAAMVAAYEAAGLAVQSVLSPADCPGVRRLADT